MVAGPAALSSALNTRGVVLVTGGSGALGSRLLHALGENGWRCRCLVHRRPVSAADETVRGDVTHMPSLYDALNGVTAVAHLAAITHSRSAARYDDVNVRGTKNLLAAARAAEVERFLFVSTRAISPNGGAYSRSKHLSEEAVRNSNLEWTIVRLPEVYGAGSNEGVDRMIAAARRGAPIPIVGHGDDILCPAHVDDVVAACARALEIAAAVRHTYTLAGPCVSMRELAELAQEVSGRRSRLLQIPVPAIAALAAASRVIPLPVYPDQLARLRCAKPPRSPEAATDLDFTPRSLRDGLVAARHTE
jgi:nucleoside-diphosphate-sugar epimerase